MRLSQEFSQFFSPSPQKQSIKFDYQERLNLVSTIDIDFNIEYGFEMQTYFAMFFIHLSEMN